LKNQTKPALLPVVASEIPDALKNTNRWLMWRLIEKAGGKWAKVPHSVNGKPVDPTASSSWRTFDDALNAYTLGNFDGIGFVFDGSDGLHGIDVDGCVDSEGRLNFAAQELLDNVQGYAEISPSGTGIKLFTRTNLTGSSVKKPFEVYTSGRYFTVTGSVITGHEDVAESEQDLRWFVDKHIGKLSFSALAVSDDFDALSLYKPPLNDWDLEKVEQELIPFLDALSLSTYEGWVKVGMAFHHQGSGDEAWMELWDKVSQDTDSYDRDELEAKWRSFSQQRAKGNGSLTLASLLKDVADKKVELRKQAVESYRRRILDADDADALKAQICLDIQADLTIDRFDRDVLAQVVKARFKVLGVAVSLQEIKRLLKPKNDGHSPEWLEDWVFVTHEDKFFNVSTKRKVSEKGFNALYNREVGGMDSDVKASSMAMDLWRIEIPDKIIYLPSAGEYFDLNGMPCVNMYDPSSPPDIVDSYSAGDLEAIETVKKHFALVLTEEGAVNIMLAWIAFCVQNPGKKVRWAPLVKGIEGDGKTVIGKLLSAVMGMVNVGNVSTSVLNTAFTSWAEGRCINILEEIRMVGHNRHDVLNMLKPYITNDAITVHPKGINEYVAPNTVNYIAFTNHSDALPLEETDRRWWVSFTPFIDQKQLKEATGLHYFEKLHNAIEGHPGALRKWLLSYQIPESFEPNGQAPASAAKNSMIGLNTSDSEQIIKEVIEQGCSGVCHHAVSTSHLSTALSFNESLEEVPKTSAIARVMLKLGYTRMPKAIKWNGVLVRVWNKNIEGFSKMQETEANEKIRELLDKTMEDSILG